MVPKGNRKVQRLMRLLSENSK